MDSYLWKESKWEDTNKKDMRLCNQAEGSVCIKEREDPFLV